MSAETRTAVYKAMKAAAVNGCDPYNSHAACAYWYDRQARFKSFKKKGAK